MSSLRYFAIVGIMVAFLAAIGYVGLRIYKILPFPTGWKIAAIIIYSSAIVALFLSFTGRLDPLPMNLATVLYILGNTWLIFFVYTFMAFALTDILRLFHVLSPSFLSESKTGSAVIFGLVAIILLYGRIHYQHKYREEIVIQSDKVSSPVTFVLASDLHLGYHNRRPELARWIDIINAENPDAVLIAGDIIDRSVRPLIEDKDAEEFLRLNAPVYACLGNHEYYSGAEASEKFFNDAGIQLLKNTSEDVHGITVIGRDDAYTPCRTPLSDIMEKTDSSTFRILLDHQPNSLSEAENIGVDFQFSGHTHHGQIWPASLVTDLIFEDAYGHLTKGNTRYYVTSGLGLWGGRFRIGTRSEYVLLKLVP